MSENESKQILATLQSINISLKRVEQHLAKIEKQISPQSPIPGSFSSKNLHSRLISYLEIIRNAVTK